MVAPPIELFTENHYQNCPIEALSISRLDQIVALNAFSEDEEGELFCFKSMFNHSKETNVLIASPV